MIDIRKLQSSLGVTADGIAGYGTFTALFRKCGANEDRAKDMAVAAVRWFPDYGLMEGPLRLAHFLAQVIHESGGFRYMEEIWGPTAAQKGYEGRKDLGNTQPGDGPRFKGHGPIQVTGRGNHRTFGRKIGIDLEQHPELAAIPSIGLHIALEYWKDRKLNALADADDVDTITLRINGGLTGISDRRKHLAALKAWLM